MADDTVVPLGSGGVTFRALAQTSGQKWPAMVLAKVVTQFNGNNVLSSARDSAPIPVCLRDSVGQELVDAAKVDRAGFQGAVTPGIPPLFFASDDNDSGIDAGRLGIVQMTESRDVCVTLRDILGDFLGVGGNPLRVTFTGSTVQVITDNGASLTVDSGGVPLDVSGILAITSGTVTGNAGDGPFPSAGMASHGSSVVGNPVLLGREARTSDPSTVSAGAAVRAYADSVGKAVLIEGSQHGFRDSGRGTLTTTGAVDILAAPGSGRRWVVTNVQVSNAHATVGTKVEIRDGTTVKMRGQAGPVNGGFKRGSRGTVLIVGSVNTPITARCLIAGADVDVTIGGYTIAN